MADSEDIPPLDSAIPVSQPRPHEPVEAWRRRAERFRQAESSRTNSTDLNLHSFPPFAVLPEPRKPKRHFNRCLSLRADSPKVRFRKEWRWRNNVMVADGGIFEPLDYSWRRRSNHKIVIPATFFPEWAKDAKGSIVRQDIETTTPIVPAKILNPLRSHKLENYHILWEVEEWKPIPPKDPMLLKQITPNMFLVLAAWDLSPLERAVIRGRILP